MSLLEKYLSRSDIEELKTYQQSILDTKITLTCVGLYNHGKSTLLNVLVNDFDFKTFKTADIRETTLNKTVIVDNIKYMDTPGLNAKEEDDEKVLEAIQESDITLFVHTITTGEFNKKEVEFLTKIQNYWADSQEFIERVIFVLSRIDNIAESDDIDKTILRMQEQIKEIFNGSEALIIPVSALDYKDGMLEEAAELVDESNVEKLINSIDHKSKQLEEKFKITKKQRFEEKFNALHRQLNFQIEQIQTEILQLQKQQQEKERAFQEDIEKIETALESMHKKLEGIGVHFGMDM